MLNPTSEFGIAVRQKRKAKNLTQQELAAKLGMNCRTVMDAEKGCGNPKFETVTLLAQELNISLDAFIFPEIACPNAVPKCVYDFFCDLTESEATEFIALCQAAKAICCHK